MLVCQGFTDLSSPHKRGQSQIRAGSTGDKAWGARGHREEIGSIGVCARPQGLALDQRWQPLGQEACKGITQSRTLGQSRRNALQLRPVHSTVQHVCQRAVALEVRRKFAQDIWQRRKLCPITDATAYTTITATACTVLTRREEGSEVHVSNLALQHGIEQGRCGSSQETDVRILPPPGH